jgi:hypothetical protein
VEFIGPVFGVPSVQKYDTVGEPFAPHLSVATEPNLLKLLI